VPSDTRDLCERPLKFGEEGLLVRAAGVQLEADITQPELRETVPHHAQRGHLLGHEEHRLSVVDGPRDDVGDRLGLAGARRSLHDEVATGSDLLDDDGLRGIGLDDLDDGGRIEPVIESVFRREERRLALEAFVQEPAHESVLLEAPVRPVCRIEIPQHQELGEGEEPELHPVRVDLPALPPGDAIGDLREIGIGTPVLAVLDLREFDAEVAAESFLERQVRDYVVVACAEFEGRPLLVPDEPHGQEHEGGLPRDLRRRAFEPLQEPHREIENVEALLLFRGARIREEAQEPTLEGLGAERRLEDQIPIPGIVEALVLGKERQEALAAFRLVVLSLRREAHPPALDAQEFEHVRGALVDDVQAVGALRAAIDMDEPVPRPCLDKLPSRVVQLILQPRSIRNLSVHPVFCLTPASVSVSAAMRSCRA